MSDGGRKVPDEIRVAFDEIHLEQMALVIKADAFQVSINKEAQKIAVASKHLWDEVKSVMNLEGDWRYENGMLHPVGNQTIN